MSPFMRNYFKELHHARVLRIDELYVELMKLTQESHEHDFNNFLDYGMSSESEYTIDDSFQALFTGMFQSGKTGYTIKQMKKAIQKNCIVVCVSCDNKGDQQEQFKSRTEKDLGPNVKCIYVKSSKCASDIKRCIKNNQKFTLFMLDNVSQIEKMSQITNTLIVEYGLRSKQIVFFNDEGDANIRHTNVHEIQPGQAKAHRGWIELMNKMKFEKIIAKRVYITATPLLVCASFKIPVKNVYSFLPDPHYTGVKDFEFIEYSENNNDIIISECERITQDTRIKFGSAVLICDEHIKTSQEVSVEKYSKIVPHVPTHTYNGNEHLCYIPNSCPSLLEKLTALKSQKTGKNQQLATGTILTIKKMTIRKLYSIFKECGIRVALTIGNLLFGRGLSLVSECEQDHFFASVMILQPGKTRDISSIGQIAGRLAGNVGPGVPRKIYTSKSIISDTKTMCTDQPRYLDKLKRSRESGIETDTMISHKKFRGTREMKHNIDRIRKTCQVGDAQVLLTEREEESETCMKRLIKSWINPNNDSFRAYVFRYILNFGDNGVQQSRVVESLQNYRNNSGKTSQEAYTLVAELLVPTRQTSHIFKKQGTNLYISTLANSIISSL